MRSARCIELIHKFHTQPPRCGESRSDLDFLRQIPAPVHHRVLLAKIMNQQNESQKF